MRTALITGGASGIGEVTATRLKSEDLHVVTADLNPHADITLDVSSPQAVHDAISTIGPVDVLVNSAGIVGPNMPAWEISDDEWARAFSVNVNGVFNMCRAVVPGMIERGWGRIVNVASIAGKEGNPNLSAYSASKAAVIGFTKSLGK
jgi:2-dehydro-3-deoxy-L-rhamnonate dehydrogenase (NAD+)